MNLGFRIVRASYHPSSKIHGELYQKVRDDGRVGAVVGDEVTLWNALQDCHSRLQAVLQALEDETAKRVEAEKERDKLQGMVQGLTDRVAAQSEALSKQAEKPAGEQKGRNKR